MNTKYTCRRPRTEIKTFARRKIRKIYMQSPHLNWLNDMKKKQILSAISVSINMFHKHICDHTWHLYSIKKQKFFLINDLSFPFSFFSFHFSSSFSNVCAKNKYDDLLVAAAGILRNSTIATQRDGIRHSAPITTLRTGTGTAGNYHTHPHPHTHHQHHHNHNNSTYHQRCSLKTTSLTNDEVGHLENPHELSALSSNGQNYALTMGNNSKDFLLKSNQRNSVRWCSPKASACTASSNSNTETTSLETAVTDKNYLANRTAMISWQQQLQPQPQQHHLDEHVYLQQSMPLEDTSEAINYFHQQRTNGNGSLIYNTLTNGNSNNIHYNSSSNACNTSTSTMNNNLNLILNANSHSHSHTNSISNCNTMKSLLFNPNKDYVTESCSDSSSSTTFGSSSANGCIIGVGGNNGKMLFANSKSTSATANLQINDKTWL